MDKMVIIPLSEYNEMKEKIANKDYCNKEEYEKQISYLEKNITELTDRCCKLIDRNSILELNYKNLQNTNNDLSIKYDSSIKQASAFKSQIINLQQDKDLLCRFKKSIFYKMWILWNGEKK
jgi:regulator of replication initiation timing